MHFFCFRETNPETETVPTMNGFKCTTFHGETIGELGVLSKNEKDGGKFARYDQYSSGSIMNTPLV